MLFMLELDQYINIEHVYCELYQYVNGAKSLNISIYLRQNCINNNYDAINILHKIYDKNSYIECELIVYAVDNIIYFALHEK